MGLPKSQTVGAGETLPPAAADRPPPTPRWVWVAGAAAAALLLAFLLLHLAGGGLRGHAP